MNSDYNVVVGRSRLVEGPYVDREGKLMTRGGGTLVAKGNARWAGVGHNSAYTMNGKSIIVMHGYDKLDNGRSKLIIKELKWDRSDWPSLGFEELRPLGSRTEAFGGLERFVYPALKNALEDGRPF